MNDAQFYEKVVKELKNHNQLEREKITMLKVLDAHLQVIDEALREGLIGGNQDD